MKRELLLGAACALIFSACGAARHGVVEPESAASLSSTDWNVKSPPAAAEPEAEAQPQP